MSQVKEEMLKPKGPNDFENAASVVEEETEKLIRRCCQKNERNSLIAQP
jgi:hypothetical protein